MGEGSYKQRHEGNQPGERHPMCIYLKKPNLDRRRTDMLKGGNPGVSGGTIKDMREEKEREAHACNKENGRRKYISRQ